MIRTCQSERRGVAGRKIETQRRVMTGKREGKGNEVKRRGEEKEEEDGGGGSSRVKSDGRRQRRGGEG